MQIRCVLIFFLWVSVTHFWACQNHSAGSPAPILLEQEIDSLIQETIEARKFEPYTIVALSDSIIKLSYAANYLEGEIRGYYHRAAGYFFKSEYEKAEEDCQNVLGKLENSPFLDSISHHNFEGATYILLGVLKQKQGKYKDAVPMQLKALEHFEATANWGNMASAYSNLSENFRFIKNYEKAIDYNKKAEDFFLKAGKPMGLPVVMQNRGNIFFNQGNYEAALEIFKVALEEAEKHKDFENVVHAINNIGASHENLGNFEFALENYVIALEKYQERKDFWGEANTLGNISLVHLTMGQLEKAEQFSNTAIAISRAHRFLELEKSSAENLAKIYEQRGDFEKSLEMIKHGQLLQDSLYNQQKFETINRLEQQYSEERSNRIIAQKDKSIAESQLKTQRLRNIATLLGLFFLVVLLCAWLFYRQAKFRKEKNNELRQKNIIIQDQNEDLESLVNAYEAQREKFIQVGTQQIPLDEIVYIRYQNRVSSIFLKNHSIINNRTQLSQLMSELNYKSHFLFSQINQNYIVHFKNVVIEFSNGEEEKFHFTQYLPNDEDEYRNEDVIRTRKRSGLNKPFEREYQRYLRLEKLLK